MFCAALIYIICIGIVLYYNVIDDIPNICSPSFSRIHNLKMKGLLLQVAALVCILSGTWAQQAGGNSGE